jgi:acetolactate synthase-1/2/3 large subunit
VSQALLLKLKKLGVDYFFANPGTEFVSIMHAFQRFEREGIPHPQPVTVPHEFIAANMAYGAYLATGRPQAVMAHVSVGTANLLLGVMNAARMNIPMLVLAGRTPISERDHLGHRDKFIHWAQESWDQGGMLREYCKWDYELRSPDMLEEVLERAYAIAMSEPKGPVSLILPREVLLSPFRGELSNQSRVVPAAPPRGDAMAMQQMAKELRAAKRPLLVTSRSGTSARNVELLTKFSEQFHIPVLTPEAHYMNIPTEHRFHAGFQSRDLVKETDFLISLDNCVPWCPIENGPPDHARVIHVGPDPLFADIPIRSHRSDLTIQTSVSAFFEDLLAIDDGASSVSKERRAWLDQLTRPKISPSQFSADSVALALNERMNRDTILMNELSLPPEGLKLSEPGSYFRASPASGLGWGLGCALGLQLVQPEKKVISVIGDGVYYLSNPLAVHWVERSLGLKGITIILNNGKYGSIESAAKRFFPNQSGSVEAPFISLKPSLPFHDLMRTMGGRGEQVTNAAELNSALDRCLKSNQPSLINVNLEG